MAKAAPQPPTSLITTALRPALIALILLYFCIVASFSWWTYHQARNRLMHEVDTRLRIGVSAVRMLLPPDYHDRAIDSSSIDSTEYYSIMATLSSFTDSTGFLYAYSCIRIDSTIFLTANNASAKERAQKSRVPYFAPWSQTNKALHEAFELEQVRFVEARDEWGDVRSIYLPLRSASGRLFVAGIDYDISYIEKWVRQALIYSIIAALISLAAVLPLFLFLLTSLTRNLRLLHASEQRFRTFMNHLPGLAFIKDQSGQILFANSGFQKFLHMDPATMTGKSAAQLFNADCAQQVIRDDQRLLHNGGQCELEQHFADKTWVTHLFTLAQPGEPLLLGGISMDITTRKEAEQRLVAEREQLAVTLRSIGEGVITTDVDGTIVLMNRVAENYTGWKQIEAQGLPLGRVFRIINEHTRIPCENPVNKVLNSGQIIELANHTLLLDRQGRERLVAHSGAPIKDPHSSTIGVVLVFRDITEKHKVAQALQRSARLESLAILAGGIAHDFNNLLSALYGSIDLARSHGTPPQAAEYLDTAASSLERARGLTMQLLTFAKGGEPIKKVQHLFPFVQQTAQFALSGSNVSCHITTEEDLKPCAYDKTQLGQVIENLVINAQQAMPQGGCITISAKNCTILPDQHSSTLKPGDYVQITLRDTGCGIPASVLGSIFDPFFTTKNHGHGLGLATAHSIITRHGGGIEVHSVQAEGTTFTLSLPASSTVVFEEESSLAQDHKGSGVFLIMDDEEVIRRTISALFKTMGYTVCCVQSGEQALERFGAPDQPPIVGIMMDLTIPGGMGGKEAIEQIRRLDTHMPVFVTSGYSDDPVMSRPTEFGFTASIRKPFRRDELIEMLNRGFGAPPPESGR